MKANILSINGEKMKEIEMPKFFSQPVREDLIYKVIETKLSKQPYAPSLVAGKQYSASGIIQHRRHVWKSAYGYGISRVPRKIMSRHGTRFNWIGASVPGTVGGWRAHPPKTLSMINTKKINKKEEKIALISSLSATANEKQVSEKYLTLKDKKIGKLPLIVEGKITSLKTKELISSLKKILGDLFELSLQKKKVRSGKGKLRGRKYKKNAGVLIVIGKNEKMKISGLEIQKASNIGVLDLAKGGPGRLVIYTENAIKDLEEKIK